jgi:hypothetical protein
VASFRSIEQILGTWAEATAERRPGVLGMSRQTRAPRPVQPAEQVITGEPDDDSYFFAAAAGLAYFDTVTIANQTLENGSDTSK